MDYCPSLLDLKFLLLAYFSGGLFGRSSVELFSSDKWRWREGKYQSGCQIAIGPQISIGGIFSWWAFRTIFCGTVVFWRVSVSSTCSWWWTSAIAMTTFPCFSLEEELHTSCIIDSRGSPSLREPLSSVLVHFGSLITGFGLLGSIFLFWPEMSRKLLGWGMKSENRVIENPFCALVLCLYPNMFRLNVD